MGFLLSLFIPGLVIAAAWLGPLTGFPNLVMCVPLIVGYAFVPVVQALADREPYALSPAQAASSWWRAYYRVLPLLSLPAQLAMLTVTVHAFATAPLNWSGRAVLLLTTGIFSAMFAINIAHELIHRRQRLDRVVGGLLLSTVSFGTFKVVHLQVHHPYVGTPLDFATARRGQTIYTFWLQSFAGNFREALRCEQMRTRRSGKSPWTSEVVVWTGFSLLWLTLSVAGWGWRGGLFFVAQSVFAIMYLDCINFLQHYGLTRAIGPNGRPDPVQDHHAWSQRMFLDDLILLNLPRHAAHHTQPQRPFQLLADGEGSPHYPFNYGVMTMVLLVPPLFRRIVHPCLDRFEAAHRRNPVAV